MTLASADQEPYDYSVIPAIPDVEGGKLPAARTQHAACAFNVCVAVFGGIDESGEVIDDKSTVWLFNTAKSAWETLEPVNADNGPKARSNARMFDHKNSLILYGGFDATHAPLHDVWHFDYVHKTWTALPDCPVSTPNASVCDGVLHVVAGNDNIGGDMHLLPLNVKSAEDQSWHSVPFPTNPLVPGPLPRTGAGLLPVSTGYGRNYLLYMFGSQISPPAIEALKLGEAQNDEVKETQLQYWSDMWTYQLPSSGPELKANLYEAIKPSKIKDAVRGALGMDSGKHSWAEVEVLPPADLGVSAGKVHPGPRSSFAFDVSEDRKSVVIWGGVNPKGEREGDGWVIKLQ